MTDIRIAPTSTAPGQPFQAVDLDLLLTPVGQLDTSDELATAVTIALMQGVRTVTLSLEGRRQGTRTLAGTMQVTLTLQGLTRH